MNYAIFSDFDATITLDDVHYLILDAFADPQWRAIEEDFLHGLIGSQNAIQKQFALCHATKLEIDTFLTKNCTLDPDFKQVFTYFHEARTPFFIVSDGLDYIIKRILEINHLPIPPIYANHLQWDSTKSLHQQKIIFPCEKQALQDYNPNRGKCGTCKTEIIKNYQLAHPDTQIYYVGDGETDKCAANYVDLVFPRKNTSLHHYCKEKDLPHHPFQTFIDVLNYIRKK